MAPMTTAAVCLTAKYVGTFVTTACGLFATFTDLHDHKDGHKALSRRGRVVLSLLVCGSVLVLAGDSVKDSIELRQKTADERQQNADRIRQVSGIKSVVDSLSQQQRALSELGTTLQAAQRTTVRVASDMKTSLAQTERLLEPLIDLKVGFTIALPNSDRYVRNLTTTLRDLLTDDIRNLRADEQFTRDWVDFKPFTWFGGPVIRLESIEIPPSSRLFPDVRSNPIGVSTTFGSVLVSWYRHHYRPERLVSIDNPKPDNYAFVSYKTNPIYGVGPVQLVYHIDAQELRLHVSPFVLTSISMVRNGTIVSVRDLVDSEVRLELRHAVSAGDRLTDSQVYSLLKGASIRQLVIEVAKGRQFYLDPGKFDKLPNSELPVYVGLFPPEYRTEYLSSKHISNK
jgi:hypothetical protein